VFRLRPTLDGVIGLGPTWRDVTSGFPANLRGFEWVSQPRVFAKADAVIHHGGINTCVEAASYGLPMLAYTPGVRDMHGTVSRMAYHGLGLIGDRDKDSPQTIAQCLDHILADPTIRERADHMKKALEAERARSVLEQTIDGLLRAPLTPRHRAGD
ncbi:MAG: nucleotide disphospho-sugar-binding domain-containing protein, partial [Pseudomonadota bacterium]